MCLEDLVWAINNLKKNKVKKKSYKFEEVDWKTLQRGDLIKSIGGHGPYYNSKLGKRYKGEYGVFKVDEVIDNGVYVFRSAKRKGVFTFGGRRFIYMGPKEKYECIWREPHKLIRLAH